MADVTAFLAELRAPHSTLDRLHLNNAGVAPTSARAIAAGQATLARMQEGSFGVGAAIADYERARATFARLVNAQSDHVAFFQTCAAAISQVAMGLSFQPGDEIVLIDQEYPSNAYPWYRAAERAGARVVLAQSDADYAITTERIIACITPRTRVVACSWVEFQTGTMIDLAAVANAAHAVGAWLVVDAIQGLGVIPFDMKALGVDAVCGGTHKWLMGPLGHGFLALAHGHVTSLTPLLHGAMSYGTPDDAVDPTRPLRVDARRFEPGNPLLVGAVAGAASVELLLSIGIDTVHAEATRLSRTLDTALRARGHRVLRAPDAQSPIVTFVPRSGDAKALVDTLKGKGAFVAHRAGGVRVSPHAHNSEAHIAQFVALLDIVTA